MRMNRVFQTLFLKAKHSTFLQCVCFLSLGRLLLTLKFSVVLCTYCKKAIFLENIVDLIFDFYPECFIFFLSFFPENV